MLSIDREGTSSFITKKKSDSRGKSLRDRKTVNYNEDKLLLNLESSKSRQKDLWPDDPSMQPPALQ